MHEQKGMYEFDYKGLITRISDVLGKESYLSFAKRAGMSDTAFKRYIINGTVPPVDKAWMIACAASTQDASQSDIDKLAAWIAFGIGDRPKLNDYISEQSKSYTSNKFDEFTLIDSYAIYASAGHGSEIGHELQTEPMSFRTEWLKKEGFPAERLAVIRAKGDSMEPTISDNDVILVLLANGDAPRDGLHVIRLDGGLFVKRLQFDPLGAVYVKSDNPAYSSMTISKDERSQLHVIGRVVWAGKKF